MLLNDRKDAMTELRNDLILDFLEVIKKLARMKKKSRTINVLRILGSRIVLHLLEVIDSSSIS